MIQTRFGSSQPEPGFFEKLKRGVEIGDLSPEIAPAPASASSPVCDPPAGLEETFRVCDG